MRLKTSQNTIMNISITGSVTNTDSTFIINNPVVVNGQQTVYTQPI